MSLPLQTLDLTGEVNYINKHNANYAAIQSAIEALQALTGAAAGSAANLSNTQTALFGDTTSILGPAAYLPSIGGTVLTVASGDAWIPSQLTVVGKNTSTPIDFAALGAGTYYVTVDSTGEPSVSTSPTNALYSVVWSGAALSDVTRVAAVAFGDATYDAALISAAFNLTYTDLDERIEGVEKAVTARHSQSMAAGDAALTQAQAMQAATIRLTGVLTANQTLTLPTTNKPYIIINDCSGGFAVYISGGGGANVTTQDGGRYLVAVQDTDVILIAVLASDAAPHVIAAQYNDTLPSDYELLAYIFTLSVDYGVNFPGSYAKARVAATAQTDFDIQKNGSSIGTMRFAAAATTATFIVGSAQSFVAGDDFDIIAPTTPDATLSGVRVSIKGTKV